MCANDEGSLLITEEYLLTKNRNTYFDKRLIEKILNDYLAVTILFGSKKESSATTLTVRSTN